ncbi:MAG: PorT family protein [Tannerellaceae bacterium]|jgi:hypothetical protein|nr:PorT family protein [Tannerellaceae bacterium]
MKKAILLIMLITLPFISASSQEGIALTPRAGLNLATISSTRQGSLKPGLNFGISANLMLTSQWGIETGLIYSMQGKNFNQLSPSLDYINIPLMAKFYLTDYYTESRGLYLVAGPQIGFIAVMDKVGYIKGYEGMLMPDAITKEFDAAAIIGIGYELESGLTLSANLNFGIVNIAKDEIKAYTSYAQATTEEIVKRDRAYSNTVFQLNFGYRFKL